MLKEAESNSLVKAELKNLEEKRLQVLAEEKEMA